jgi:pimeloyl-ACP methyl ester carboxylesterase
VKAGYAWAGSTYRRGGYGVTMSAQDTERLRQLFVARFGQPRRTILHGQSYGGGVAAKGAELYATAANGKSPYDALMLTSGVIGGGTRNYDFRLDLRVVYEQICANHPMSGETPYPLWLGLPKGSPIKRAEVASRMNECLGLGTPASLRSPEQQQRLHDVLSVIKVPERTLASHMYWATFLFEDLTQKRLGSRNPFGNIGAVYAGSSDDATLNAKVLRYAADPAAVADLAQDADLTGRVNIPTLTLHAVDDPTAFVELESQYRATRVAAGTDDLLVQNFADEHEHSYLSDPEYVTMLSALLDWVDKGVKPTPAGLAAACATQPAIYKGGCHWLPVYRPGTLDSRTPPRQR